MRGEVSFVYSNGDFDVWIAEQNHGARYFQSAGKPRFAVKVNDRIDCTLVPGKPALISTVRRAQQGGGGASLPSANAATATAAKSPSV